MALRQYTFRPNQQKEDVRAVSTGVVSPVANGASSLGGTVGAILILDDSVLSTKANANLALEIFEQLLPETEWPFLGVTAPGSWTQFGSTGSTPTITANYTDSPIGTQDAVRVRWQGTGTGSPTLRVPVSGVAASANYRTSFWVRPRNLGNTTGVVIDVGDGTLASVALSALTLNVWRQISVVSASSAAASQWVDTELTGWTTSDLDLEFWGFNLQPA